jgi:hypothetical protein
MHLCVPQTRIRIALHKDDMYLYLLKPRNQAVWLEFCNLCSANQQLHQYILFYDEAQFTCDSINSTCNSHVWSEVNACAVVEGNCHHWFNVSV